MTQILQINVLGPFAAYWPDGKSIDFPKKAQALLAYLAIEQDRSHSRDKLANLLWGENSDDRARHNLRQVLLKIRQCCDSLLLANGELLKLDPQSCNTDVAEFEKTAKCDTSQQLEQCLDFYRGELLHGLVIREAAFEDWLILTRSRLRRIACEASDKLIALLTAENKHDGLVQTLNQRLEVDPACEPAHCKLMELYHHAGRRSDALRQYHHCVESLQRELDVEPCAETKALFSRIQQGETINSNLGPAQTSAKVILQHTRDKPTVAVLPFNMLEPQSDSYFVDGIVEDIIMALSRFGNLQVISRGSTFHYRGKDILDRQIAEELGAQYLVRGSVQHPQAKLRINVQLLDANSGVQLWGERFDRDLQDVFILQDEISSTLASTLVGQVEAARLASTRKAPPERLDAYDMLLRGKAYHHRFTAEDCERCIHMFEQAIARDPEYAVAYSWLACGLGQAMVFELDDIAKLVDKSQAAAERGLELDENESECHRLLAQIYLTRKDLKRSLWHQERALLLNPNDDQSVCSMGEILSYVSRYQEAEQWVRKSMQLNPYHPQRYWTHLARPLFHLQRYEETLSALNHISPLRMDDHVYRIAATAQLGNQVLLLKHKAQMLQAYPDLNPMAFAETLPYDKDEDRQTLIAALAKNDW